MAEGGFKFNPTEAKKVDEEVKKEIRSSNPNLDKSLDDIMKKKSDEFKKKKQEEKESKKEKKFSGDSKKDKKNKGDKKEGKSDKYSKKEKKNIKRGQPYEIKVSEKALRRLVKDSGNKVENNWQLRLMAYPPSD